MMCKCGGVLLTIAIEEPPEHLSIQEKLVYERLCDVQCVECDKIYYSQPYDGTNLLNPVRNTKNI